jgi:hypothetical protein
MCLLDSASQAGHRRPLEQQSKRHVDRELVAYPGDAASTSAGSIR